MKFKNIMIIILLIFSNYVLSAHNEKSHQYIVIEALKLLEKQLSLNFSEMNLYRGNIGEDTKCDEYDWFKKGKIVSGAYLEDIYDPVYNFNTKVLGYNISLFQSTSHFWDPDSKLNYNFLNAPSCADDNLLFNFIAQYILIRPWPTAKSKTLDYISGPWMIQRKENEDSYGYNVVIYKFNNNLIDFYTNGTIIKFIYWYHFKLLKQDGPFLKANYQVNWSVSDRKKLVYNVLGRLCHLLADMSVPAHVHKTIHINECNIGDYYENWMAYDLGNLQFWTADKVYEERGGFINPYCNEVHNFNTTIEYLMYTMAQIAQHYASRAVSGNDIFNPDIGEIKSILDTYGDVGPTVKSDCGYVNDVTNLSGIRETTIPHLIRATAGLLYWFLVETGEFQSLYEKNHCSQIVKLNLSNQYINGDYYTFSCGLTDHQDDTQGKITTCPLENQFFTIGANARNVTFNAPKEIILKPGTSVLEGSDVLFKLGQCNDCLDQEVNPIYGKR